MVASAAAAGDASVAVQEISQKVESTSETLIQKSADGASATHEGLKRLEELTWESTFVDELPGDPVEDNHVRIVSHFSRRAINESA